jgi:tRNA-splicing ligase RtcB
MTVNRLNSTLYSWASIAEPSTLEQAFKTASMPNVWPHMALMPDCHVGAGATVGSVIPTRASIIPAAVGVDIGCGMMAVRTQFYAHDLPGGAGDLTILREQIEAVIPLSKGGYNTSLFASYTSARIADLERRAAADGVEPDRHLSNWALQLGSLGSGNHFIEVSLDENDQVWLFLHSGSRGVGNKMAQKHIKVAKHQCAQRFIKLPDPDLAYLVQADPEFWEYMRDLRWAQYFAFQNRAEMMDRVREVFSDWMNEAVVVNLEINCHHNYTEQEEHYGKQVWLSRKGAINAEKGRLGLIPGSMGTRSYVVEGLGNPLSFNSSPHGAGRNYSRSRAKATFTRDQLDEAMKGIEWRHTDAFLDEIPQAYKDIDVVMDDSKDLVTVKHELRQILNCKGD